ncbi:hypothetical protein BDV25DRAFT_171083 [Aspergillus avenaceus]|uniref:UBA domain-containing protein Ucp14 n=1 Tax=Aspergillus avenaceus TaxID=36643 RepID=A0A5N6TFD0_ASPAV|nr:hypothetical protein BDV25DRAFT_171083 [Aspergillus avenaceus]
MQTSGLTNTPLTKTLLIYLLTTSIALSILDIKHLAAIHISPHILLYAQYWRLLSWQLLGFTNSTEALFAAMLVYHLRVVERAWGGRKVATFLLTTLPYTTLLPPLLLILLIRPLSLTRMNYLPAGLTSTVFALLAQYHVEIPCTVRYTISTSTSSSGAGAGADAGAGSTSDTSSGPSSTSSPGSGSESKSLTLLFSDKSTTYLIAAQLALSQFPGNLVPALIGWFVGLAWRMEILPGSGGGWRVPAWVVGEKERVVGSGRYEDLRRRLEGEAAAVEASGVSSSSTSGSAGLSRRG